MTIAFQWTNRWWTLSTAFVFLFVGSLTNHTEQCPAEPNLSVYVIFSGLWLVLRCVTFQLRKKRLVNCYWVTFRLFILFWLVLGHLLIFRCALANNYYCNSLFLGFCIGLMGVVDLWIILVCYIMCSKGKVCRHTNKWKEGSLNV